MLANYLSTAQQHLLIDAIVIAFLFVSTIYNWKLIKEFKIKVTKAYLEHRLSKVKK
jgi:hypothetical protein